MKYMHDKSVALLLTVIFTVVTGCATPATRQIEVSDVAAEREAQKQREIALEAITRDKFRLVDVAYNIYVKSVPLCKDGTTHSIGTLVANQYMVSEDMRTAAYSLHGISDLLKIVHVMKGSVAEKAGIKKHDIPVAINEWPVPVGENAGKEFHDRLEQTAREESTLSLKIMRDGMEKPFELVPDRICDYKIALSNNDSVNAFADGEHVVIMRGMMRFAENDTELALVVSHELAHNVMRHIRAKTRNVLFGTVLDIVAAVFGVSTQGTFGRIGAQAYSREFESEADYVGLYMMALAGLDIDNAPHFWRRMAAIHPGSIENNFMATHPGSPERFVALEQAVQEIKQKIAHGLPLRPEMKKSEHEE